MEQFKTTTWERPRVTKLKWYKRDFEAALNGMMPLSLEERGAYNTILDLIYMKNGKLLDDDHFICGWLRCDVRVWKRIKARLLELHKIEVFDGYITNLRATYEVTSAELRATSTSEARRSSGIKSGIVRRKNKELGLTNVEQPMNRVLEKKKEREEKEESLSLPLSKLEASYDQSARATEQAALTAWAALASDLDLPPVQRLTAARSGKLRDLMKIIGGVQGWYALMDKIRNSRYLRGEVKDWRVTFDWLLDEQNTTKVMEGNYDDGNRKPQSEFSRAIADVTAGLRERFGDPQLDLTADERFAPDPAKRTR